MTLAVLHSTEEWAERFGKEIRAAVSIGNFDGLHLGHQKILKTLVERARANGQRSCVISFDPHPLRLLRPELAPQMIQTLAQRLAGMEQLGVDAALVLRFDRALSQVSPEDFMERFLVQGLSAGTILVGENFNFGYRGAGNVHLLSAYGKTHRFSVQIVAQVEIGGRVISSTAVRIAISSGNVGDAIPLLGRPFSLTGEIRAGAGRGRTILVPTLNLVPEQELLPKLGVYATECVVTGKTYFSVTNVGTRPTFDGQGVVVESHLFAFREQLTGGPMEVRFHARLREEMKFSGPDALREQIARDIANAEKYFGESKLRK
jgi:riboflavin kinase / FMN adenylyltransferase